MPYDGVGDAAHKRPPDTAKAPAAHDDQASSQLLAQMDYLLVRASPDKVGVRHSYPLVLDLLDLPIEERLSLVHGILELMLHFVCRPRQYGVRKGLCTAVGNTYAMCNSELVLWAKSAAVVSARLASLEPSVASSIFVGNMLISTRLLDRVPYMFTSIERHNRQIVLMNVPTATIVHTLVR
jgi:hypothetical protein